jgi:uncharacterized protein YndB with AHSA1/START domain
MLKTIAIALVVAVAAILAVAGTRPDTFRVERSTRIKAPAQVIFRYVNDFHQWGVWSPYEKLDPSMKKTFDGNPEGKGAVYEWEGNGKAGKGRMEIIESAPPAGILIKLDFIKPITGHNMARFTFQPSGAATRVTWSMDGPTPYIAKLMGLFFNMDALIGGDFETGLANLAAVSEK